MKHNTFKEKIPAILFGNGEIPKHPIVIKTLNRAKKIICLDGGVDKLIKIGYKPKYVLGDLDSINNDPDKYDCEIIKLPNQSKTDLEKGLNWCINNKISKVMLIGFSGLRDDHYMANLWTILHYANEIYCTFISDECKVLCINGIKKIKTTPGQTVSIIASSPDTMLRTKGLKHELGNELLSSPGNGISNIALKEEIEIQSDNWVWVFLRHL